MYINLHLLLFNFAYLFFLFFPLNKFIIIIALFPTWHLALVLFFTLCFSFVLVDIIFGFFYSLDQSIVLYFCLTVLIFFMGVYVFVYIQPHFLLLL